MFSLFVSSPGKDQVTKEFLKAAGSSDDVGASSFLGLGGRLLRGLDIVGRPCDPTREIHWTAPRGPGHEKVSGTFFWTQASWGGGHRSMFLQGFQRYWIGEPHMGQVRINAVAESKRSQCGLFGRERKSCGC